MDLFKKMLAGADKRGLVYVGGYSEGYSGTSSDINIPLNSLTGGVASQPADNDIVILSVGIGGYYLFPETPNLPSGYTSITVNTENQNPHASTFRACYKIMTSTPDTSVTLPSGTHSNDDSGAIALHVWRGVDLSTPLDVAVNSSTETGSIKVDAGSITPVTDGAIILVLGTGVHLDGIDTFSSAELSNFKSSGGNDSYDCSTGIGSYEWTSGAFDPAQWTFSGSDSSTYHNCNATIALRPA